MLITLQTFTAPTKLYTISEPFLSINYLQGPNTPKSQPISFHWSIKYVTKSFPILNRFSPCLLKKVHSSLSYCWRDFLLWSACWTNKISKKIKLTWWSMLFSIKRISFPLLFYQKHFGGCLSKNMTIWISRCFVWVSTKKSSHCQSNNSKKHPFMSLNMPIKPFSNC